MAQAEPQRLEPQAVAEQPRELQEVVQQPLEPQAEVQQPLAQQADAVAQLHPVPQAVVAQHPVPQAVVVQHPVPQEVVVLPPALLLVELPPLLLPPVKPVRHDPVCLVGRISRYLEGFVMLSLATCPCRSTLGSPRVSRAWPTHQMCIR